MNRADVKVDIYLDTPEQKRDLRGKAGQRDMSMTAFAKAIVLKALGDPLFLSSLSDFSDDCQQLSPTQQDESPTPA